MPPEYYEYFKPLVEFTPMVGVAELKVKMIDGAKVERVIFNGPATIVFWDDGEKTVVKCRECAECDPLKLFEGQSKPCLMAEFDYEKAVMAAMLKRLYRNYQDVLREVLA